MNLASAAIKAKRFLYSRTTGADVREGQTFPATGQRSHTSMTKKTNAFWFFVAFIVGGTAVWLTKIMADAHPWFAAMVAAGVVFALMVYYLLNDEEAPEEEGDNVYYLGLLFTLISLMVSLVELFGSGAGAIPNDEKIHALLKNFGIALVSTVVGIAGRVVLLNWQRTGPESSDYVVDQPSPPASASYRDLEEFNRNLLGRIARELTQGANALARFHRTVRSHASETEDYLHNHSEALKRESVEFKETLQRNTDSFAQELKNQVENTLRAFDISLGAIAQRVETFVDTLQASHDRYLGEIRDTTRLFHDEIQSANSRNLDALQQGVNAVAEQSRSLAGNLFIANKRIGETFDNLDSGLERAGDASTTLGSNAEQAAKSTAALEAEVEKLRTVLVPLHASAAAVMSILEAVGELDARIRAGLDSEQTATAVQQVGEGLQTINNETAAATSHAAKATELIDALTRSIRTTEDNIQRAAEALRTLASEAEARTEALRRRQGFRFRLFWNRSQ